MAPAWFPLVLVSGMTQKGQKPLVFTCVQPPGSRGPSVCKGLAPTTTLKVSHLLFLELRISCSLYIFSEGPIMRSGHNLHLQKFIDSLSRAVGQNID